VGGEEGGFADGTWVAFFCQQNASERAKSEFFATKLCSINDQEQGLLEILSDAILQMKRLDFLCVPLQVLH
jgi:hypothetical protein